MKQTCVYACTFEDYDYTIGPLYNEGSTELIRYGDWTPDYKSRWKKRPIPSHLESLSQTLINRYLKLHPKVVTTGSNICIYVDGNILILSDLQPLVDKFAASQCDIALFPHPSGRTVEEEMNFAYEVGRIGAEDKEVMESQRKKYATSGVLEKKITENTVIFYNMHSQKIDDISAMWWNELLSYTRRDQISLPYVLECVQPRVMIWPWHFDDPDNPYFLRISHKPKDRFEAIKYKAEVLGNYSTPYNAYRYGLRAVARIKRLGFPQQR